MDHQMRFGHWGAGACFVLCLLLASPGLPQEAPVPSPALADTAVVEVLPDPAATLPTIGDLELRNQVVLEAIQSMQTATDAALDRQSEIMRLQITELEVALAGQRERELTALLGSHQAMYRVTLVGGSFLAATFLLSTLFSIRTMNRFSNRLAAPLTSLQVEPGHRQSRPLRLHAVVHRLEQQILQLEQHLADPNRTRCGPEKLHLAAELKTPALKPPNPDTSNKTKASPNHSHPHHLALALGAGESILFLPREELKSSRQHHRGHFLIRIKRWLMQAGSRKAARSRLGGPVA